MDMCTLKREVSRLAVEKHTHTHTHHIHAHTYMYMSKLCVSAGPHMPPFVCGGQGTTLIFHIFEAGAFLFLPSFVLTVSWPCRGFSCPCFLSSLVLGAGMTDVPHPAVYLGSGEDSGHQAVQQMLLPTKPSSPQLLVHCWSGIQARTTHDIQLSLLTFMIKLFHTHSLSS